MNSVFALRALAAQKLLHLLGFRCRNAAKKPAIHADRSEQEIINSQSADQAVFCWCSFCSCRKPSHVQQGIFGSAANFTKPAIRSGQNLSNPNRPFAARGFNKQVAGQSSLSSCRYTKNFGYLTLPPSIVVTVRIFKVVSNSKRCDVCLASFLAATADFWTNSDSARSVKPSSATVLW